MRQIRVCALFFSLLATAGIANAQDMVYRAKGLRLYPQPSVPSGSTGLTGGRIGLWSPLTGPNANKPLWRNLDGTDSIMSGGTSSSAYQTVAEEGIALTQRLVLNFIGSGITCADNAGASRTDCTLTATGTVTSIGMTLPSWLTVSGSPVTTAGTLAITATGGQTANFVLATPNGSTGAVSLRALVANDVPALPESKITNLTTDLAVKASTSTTISAGTGLSGGGDLSANRSISLNLANVNDFTKDQGTAPNTGLSTSGTINTDVSTSNEFPFTLVGNGTLANPTNVVAGHTYLWSPKQDATGSRTLAYGTNFKWQGGTAPTLSTTANAVDWITCVARTTTELDCTWQGDFH
jgi:hypothetical protein